MEINNFYLITLSNPRRSNRSHVNIIFRRTPWALASGSSLAQVGGGRAASGRHGVRPRPPSLPRSSGAAVWTQSAGEDVRVRDEEAASQSQPG